MEDVGDMKVVMTGWIDDQPVKMAKKAHMTAVISEHNTCKRTKDGD